MLDSKFLKKWVPVVIKKEYGPDKKLENNKPLLAITLYPDKQMTEYRDQYYPNLKGTSAQLRGHLLNMGRIMELAGVEDYKKFEDRYLMKINSDLTEEAAIYSLFHEEAHLHYFITKNEQHVRSVRDADEMADNRALKRIKRLIDDPMLAMKVMLEGLSINYQY